MRETSSDGAVIDDRLALRERRGPWEGSWQYRRDCIDLLRSEFDYTIIDCPSLKESGDLLSVAPFVDGVILVIEANRTRRDEPRQAEQSITAAGGTLLGYILNKRSERDSKLARSKALVQVRQAYTNGGITYEETARRDSY